MTPSAPRNALGFALLLVAGCGSEPASAPPDAGAKAHHHDASVHAESGTVDASPDAGTEAAPTEAGEGSTVPVSVVAYASGYGPNIDWFSVDGGALVAKGSVVAFGSSPSFLAISPGATHLYAVDENTPGQVGAYSIDPKSGQLAFLGAVSSG